MVSTSIGLNAVSSHGACTAVFIIVAALASFGLASIRTLAKITWVAAAGVGCVFVAGESGGGNSASSPGSLTNYSWQS